MAASPDNILILGLAKTGSTGLYNNVKAALAAAGHDYYCLFEPTRPDQLDSIHRYAPTLPLLTKVMIAREPHLRLRYDLFPRRMTLLRDPRDMIVSFLLVRPFIRADVPWEQVEPFVEAIRAKERDPASSSVQDLHRLADDLGLASYRLERVVEFMEWQESPDRPPRRVHGALRGLHRRTPGRAERVPGLDVDKSAAASPWLAHILRSGESGDWRHWFTEEDVTAYRPYVTDYMKRFEYPDDWVLADDPVISSETASGYIEGKYRSRRRQQAQRRNGLTLDAGAPAQRDHMEHLAEDGHSQAMYRLAKAAVGGTDEPDRAFRLAHRAAVQGHRPAMRLLADLYRRGHGVEADERQAEFWASVGNGHERPRGGLRRLLGRR
ncbi:MAG TPA: hypothetical protein VK923_11070 [Euzebyales bacterium]|nr:hypothetical protein [Euzebyales bacterium]